MVNLLKASFFSEQDILLFQQGCNYELYHKMGAHPTTRQEEAGVYFSVWAPNAEKVSVIGPFNDWSHNTSMLKIFHAGSGIWEGFFPHVHPGDMYKFHITSTTGLCFDKGDPFASYWEKRPATASIVFKEKYEWNDKNWIQDRKKNNFLDGPYSVYEVNLLSWMRPDKNDDTRANSYRQTIDLLVPYVQSMGFTHVEFMPVMEYPNDASWGYQGTGFFAPTSRFGNPTEFKKLIDAFHQAGIGVILDWVPSHFPYDAHGLYMFDGTHLYENSDMRRGYHPDWHSYIFDYGKGPVKSFLISSARYWADEFHADGLRVDGVSSLLILSYSRDENQWQPNIYGEDKNLEAISFLQDLNRMMNADFPKVAVIAEESTAWPGVTQPINEGGLGFSMKWMMGWMHDTIEFFSLMPAERPAAVKKFKLSMEYYFTEKFMLALSHDEVVYGKQSMLHKMPGNKMEKFSNLRLLYTYMFTHPGAKLLFMGDEFGSDEEWNFKSELPWGLLQNEAHEKLRQLIIYLNQLLKSQPALHECQFEPGTFEWVTDKAEDDEVIVYIRNGLKPADRLIIALNMSDSIKSNYLFHVDGMTAWEIILNSDDKKFGGSGEMLEVQGTPLAINIPPLTGLILKTW